MCQLRKNSTVSVERAGITLFATTLHTSQLSRLRRDSHVFTSNLTLSRSKHKWALSEITSQIKMASLVGGHVN